MDYTALDLCLGENGLDCVFESGETVHAEKQMDCKCQPLFYIVR